MKSTYQRKQGKALTYDITTDRHGSYEVRLGDRLLRQVGAPIDYLGKKPWGSKALEAQAIRLAQGDIEQLSGMAEE